MKSSHEKLIEAIRDKDWSRAQDAFSNIMKAKVAIRLTEERRTLGALTQKEADKE
jgi:hypothetical protein